MQETYSQHALKLLHSKWAPVMKMVSEKSGGEQQGSSFNHHGLHGKIKGAASVRSLWRIHPRSLAGRGTKLGDLRKLALHPWPTALTLVCTCGCMCARGAGCTCLTLDQPEILILCSRACTLDLMGGRFAAAALKYKYTHTRHLL